MSTEYTTYGCPACGLLHQHREICPDLRRVLVKMQAMEQPDLDKHWRSMWAQVEDRVREIAREEIRAAAEVTELASTITQSMAEQDRQRAREEALEEAAVRLEGCVTWISTAVAAEMVRALKSQPAHRMDGGAASARAVSDPSGSSPDDGMSAAPSSAYRDAQPWKPAKPMSFTDEDLGLKPAQPSAEKCPQCHGDSEVAVWCTDRFHGPLADPKFAAVYDWRMRIRDLEKECDELDAKNVDLRKNREDFRRLYEEAVNERDEMRAKLATRDGHLAECVEVMKRKDAAIEQISAKLAAAESTIASARKAEGFGALPMENEILKQHVGKLEAKLAEAYSALDGKRNKIDEINAKLAKMDHDYRHDLDKALIAERALDEIAAITSDGPGGIWVRSLAILGQILKRTGRLGGSKEGA